MNRFREKCAIYHRHRLSRPGPIPIITTPRLLLPLASPARFRRPVWLSRVLLSKNRTRTQGKRVENPQQIEGETYGVAKQFIKRSRCAAVSCVTRLHQMYIKKRSSLTIYYYMAIWRSTPFDKAIMYRHHPHSSDDLISRHLIPLFVALYVYIIQCI